MARPLSPASATKYRALLVRAYGRNSLPLTAPAVELDAWPHSQLELLRAAVRRVYLEAAADPAAALRRIPTKWTRRRIVVAPTEEEATAYEMAAVKRPPKEMALALLPLAVGLRSQELLQLPREAVVRASIYGRLKLFRKGGVEQELPVGHAKELFEALLHAKAAPGRLYLGQDLAVRGWRRIGEILSPSGPAQEYHALWKLVHSVGRDGGVRMRPHLLRHVFATRMQAAGASLAQIQYALGHALPTTTARYVHVEAQHVEKFMRAPLMAGVSGYLGGARSLSRRRRSS